MPVIKKIIGLAGLIVFSLPALLKFIKKVLEWIGFSTAPEDAMGLLEKLNEMPWYLAFLLAALAWATYLLWPAVHRVYGSVPRARDDYHRLPGRAAFVIARFIPQWEERRKVLLDMPSSKGDGITVYFTAQNRMRFQVVDLYGDVHAVEATMPKDFQYHIWHYFYVAVGVVSNFTVLSLFVDKHCVTEHRLDYALNLGTFANNSTVIGADRNSRNNAAVHLMSLAIFDSSLRRDDLHNMWRLAETKLAPKAVPEQSPT